MLFTKIYCFLYPGIKEKTFFINLIIERSLWEVESEHIVQKKEVLEVIPHYIRIAHVLVEFIEFYITL